MTSTKLNWHNTDGIRQPITYTCQYLEITLSNAFDFYISSINVIRWHSISSVYIHATFITSQDTM